MVAEGTAKNDNLSAAVLDDADDSLIKRASLAASERASHKMP